LDVEPSLDRLRKTDEKLALVEELTTSVRTERENEWPKKTEDVTASIVPPSLQMLDRTQEYPYLDGNYTVRCVVTLKLLSEQKEAVTCAEKTEKVNSLAKNLLGFKLLPENKNESDETTDTATDSLTDTATDSLTDTATDSLTDTATDSLTDTATDSLTDTATDSLMDTATDSTESSYSNPS